MNLAEIKDEFTVLFEDLATNGSKGLDDYEISLCLTNAQRALVRAATMSKQLEFISTLVVSQVESLSTTPGMYNTSISIPKVTKTSYVDGYLVKGNTINSIVSMREVTPDVIETMYESPFKYPPKGLAYVVVGDSTYEVFPPLNYGAATFKLRYVKDPAPIVVSDLSLLTPPSSLEGVTAPTLPSIDDSMQDALVNEAVKYAVGVYIGTPNTKQQPQ